MRVRRKRIEKVTVAHMVDALESKATLAEDELARASAEAFRDLAELQACATKYAKYGIKILQEIVVNEPAPEDDPDQKARKAWRKDLSNMGKRLAETAALNRLPEVTGVTSVEALLTAVVDQAPESDLCDQPRVALIIQDAKHRAAKAAQEENNSRLEIVRAESQRSLEQAHTAYEQLERSVAVTIADLRAKLEKVCRERSAATRAALRISARCMDAEQKARQESLLRTRSVSDLLQLSDRCARLAATRDSLAHVLEKERYEVARLHGVIRRHREDFGRHRREWARLSRRLRRRDRSVNKLKRRVEVLQDCIHGYRTEVQGAWSMSAAFTARRVRLSAPYLCGSIVLAPLTLPWIMLRGLNQRLAGNRTVMQ